MSGAPRGVLLIGPRSLDARDADRIKDQARWFVELNKHKCSFILLPDLPGTSLEVCDALPDWLEVIVVSARWRPSVAWENKRYDRMIKLPERIRRGYADEELDMVHASARSYRFGVDWVVPRGAVLAFRDEKKDREVEGAIHYAKAQELSVFIRSMKI